MIVIPLTDKPPCFSRESVLITANVTNGESNAVAGARAHITVTTGSGELLDWDPTTDSSGEATRRYRVNAKRDGVVIYAVDVEASIRV